MQDEKDNDYFSNSDDEAPKKTNVRQIAAAPETPVPKKTPIPTPVPSVHASQITLNVTADGESSILFFF